MIIKINSNKYGAVEFLMDDKDFETLKGWSFYAWGTKRHYGLYLKGYSPSDRRRPQRVHRVLLNAKSGEIVDHINGNPQDNRRENLRITTSKINNQNARKRKDGITSKYKGVHFCARALRWKAQIQVDNKRVRLGEYKTEIEAAKAYDRGLELYGSVGRKNLT